MKKILPILLFLIGCGGDPPKFEVPQESKHHYAFHTNINYNWPMTRLNVGQGDCIVIASDQASSYVSTSLSGGFYSNTIYTPIKNQACANVLVLDVPNGATSVILNVKGLLTSKGNTTNCNFWLNEPTIPNLPLDYTTNKIFSGGCGEQF